MPRPQYSSDRPITSRREDLLGRGKFAKNLARDLQRWTEIDSLVVALYGGWGSGKSSLKNLILEEYSSKQNLPVMEFNPWQLSRNGGIQEAFFRELRIALNAQGSEGEVQARSEKINAYAKALGVFSRSVRIVAGAMPMVGIPGGPIVDELGVKLGDASEVASEGAAAMQARSAAQSKSLAEQKKELWQIMAEMSQPILIVIDDIDRLATEEILELFQLVKASADFPRLVYLLLFEREIVAGALNRISGDRGMEFLEKIVQVGYHVPDASSDSVHKVLFSGLNRYLDAAPVQKHWNRRRWHDLYELIGEYFSNLRQVYRFLGSWGFHIRHHLSRRTIEVNPIDLIGLEVLRVFEAPVFERMARSKGILTRDDKGALFGGVKQEIVDATIDRLLEPVPKNRRDRVKAVIDLLFPTLSPAYSKTEGIRADQDAWLRSLRVCHPAYFDKYFTLTLADNDISQLQLECLIVATGDSKNFCSQVQRLIQDEIVEVALDRLDAHKEAIPIQNMGELTRALMQIGDLLPRRELRLFKPDAELSAARVLYFGLKRIQDIGKRVQIVKDAMRESSGLSQSLQIISSAERTEERDRRAIDYLIPENEISNLKDIWISKLRARALVPGFMEDPRLNQYLWFWSGWAGDEEVRKWVEDRTQQAREAIKFLGVVAGEVRISGHEVKTKYGVNLKFVERICDVNRIRSLIQGFRGKDLTPREVGAVRGFERAMKRRDEGLPDIDWSRDLDDE